MAIIIKELYQYPVAGMGGHATPELVAKPEGVVDDRVFTLVSVQNLQRWIDNPDSGFPKRLTQTEQPKLALFSGQTYRGRLQLSFQGEVFNTHSAVGLSEKRLPLCTPISIEQQRQPYHDLASRFAWPLRVSSKSQSIRWAVDCGNNVAGWLSAKLGEEVRLMQIMAERSAPKHHFTWYSALHLISLASVNALSEELGTAINPDLFRANIVVEGGQPFEELGWGNLFVNAFLVDASPCERCAYMSVDLATGQRTKPEVHRQIVNQHQGLFGIYLQLPSVKTILKKGGSIGLAHQ